MSTFVIEPPRLEPSKNALRIETFNPSSRCALRPIDDLTVIERDTRPFHFHLSWSRYSSCVRSEKCDECEIAKYYKGRPHPFTTNGCIRPDNNGWWFLNFQEKGWASYGYFYSSLRSLLSAWAVRLDERKRDEHGEYWTYFIV